MWHIHSSVILTLTQLTVHTDTSFLIFHMFQLNEDDAVYLEAFEKTIQAWMHIFTHASDIPGSTIRQHAVDMFNTYVQCHISPPDGSRGLVSTHYTD